MNAPPPKFLSDNLKSAIQNRKWAAIFAIAFTFVFGGVRPERSSQRKSPG